MRRHWKKLALLLAATAAAASVLFAIPSGEPEPSYGGKSLSYWLILMAQGRWHSQNPVAEAAVARIGAPALPYLVKWVQRAEPTNTPTAFLAIDELQGMLPVRFRRYTRYEKRVRAIGAAKSFRLIAPQATNALPVLVHIGITSAATSPADLSTTLCACIGLRDFGAEGVPYLLNLLTNYDCTPAAGALGEMGTNAYPAIPALIQCLHSRNTQLSAQAAAALGYLNHEPDLVVPAFASCLTKAGNQGLTKPTFDDVQVFHTFSAMGNDEGVLHQAGFDKLRRATHALVSRHGSLFDLSLAGK